MAKTLFDVVNNSRNNENFDFANFELKSTLLPDDYSPNTYITEKGLIKRVIDNKQMLIWDIKITPLVLIPNRILSIDGVKRIEVNEYGTEKNVLIKGENISTAKNTREFFIDSFGPEYWFDGEMKDVIEYMKILNHMTNYKKLKTIVCTEQFGWIGDKFCPYDIKPYYSDENGLNEYKNTFQSKGDYNAWSDKIEKFNKNILFETGFLTALGGPLLSKLKKPSIFLHNYGKYSSCKTASMYAFASIYGDPTKLVKGFNLTYTGFEFLSATHGNIPLFLDDSQNLSPYIDTSTLIYTAFEGKGKVRGTLKGTNTKLKTWNTTFLSNGEKPLISPTAKQGGIIKRCIELEGKMMDINDGRKCYSFFTENYGMFGFKWIEIIKNINVKYANNIINEFREAFDNKENLGDNISQLAYLCYINYLFLTEEKKIDEAKAFLLSQDFGCKIIKYLVKTSEINEFNKAMNFIKDYYSMNIQKIDKIGESFFGNEKIGYERELEIVFIKNTLEKEMEKEGFSYKVFIKEAKQKGYLKLDKTGSIPAKKYDGGKSRYPMFIKNKLFKEI
jgi:hypothetical protein